MQTPYSELKELAYLANMEILQQKLAIYTFGNASAFDAEKAVLAIKPSGVAYKQLSANDIVVVDLDGNIVEGDLRPSSDTKTHIILYRRFTGIGGIVHTHSPYATGWAQTSSAIPIYGTTHADFLTEDIPCAELLDAESVAGDYEIATGNQIINCFQTRNYLHTPMVLVAGHGPFTWGETAAKAVYHAAVLEELAKMAFITRTLVPQTQRLPEYIIKKHFNRKHGKEAYYGQL
ncbi:MAG: L-ribulose-5-phosphate 4-epimerase AraD [Deltaproteobacteria bacterium]|nr:L-ribulose-5-phosphate 4-epimerase AraD [Deltaproteobacteria bacterium]